MQGIHRRQSAGAQYQRSSDPSGEHQVSQAQNVALIREFYQRLFNDADVAFGLQCLGQPYRQHNAMVADGVEGFAAFFSGFYHAGHTLQADIKRVIADEEMVAVHAHFRGTVFPPQGIAKVDMFRFQQGKIVEHWDVAQEVPQQSLNDNSVF